MDVVYLQIAALAFLDLLLVVYCILNVDLFIPSLAKGKLQNDTTGKPESVPSTSSSVTSEGASVATHSPTKSITKETTPVHFKTVVEQSPKVAQTFNEKEASHPKGKPVDRRIAVSLSLIGIPVLSIFILKLFSLSAVDTEPKLQHMGKEIIEINGIPISDKQKIQEQFSDRNKSNVAIEVEYTLKNSSGTIEKVKVELPKVTTAQ